MMLVVKDFKELKVYRKAFDMSVKIFELSKSFPKEEKLSLTSHIRRSSRSVCSNIAEAYRRKIYPKSLASILNISEAEAAETQHWLDTALECNYIDQATHNIFRQNYDEIIGMLVNMRRSAYKWTPKK
jgi:four helix bundle protein